MYMFSCSFLYNCINIFYNVIYIFCLFYNGSFQKRSILPHRGNFCRLEGEGRKNCLFIFIYLFIYLFIEFVTIQKKKNYIDEDNYVTGVSDNSKCIRSSEGGRGVNFLFPPCGWYGCFLE